VLFRRTLLLCLALGSWLGYKKKKQNHIMQQEADEADEKLLM
jgi:hypothetical protein